MNKSKLKVISRMTSVISALTVLAGALIDTQIMEYKIKEEVDKAILK